ncbi:unnamed protein product [Bemisia tabaci]|uniref:Pyridoxal phosphate homeostasis protein n=1 Tax=Bemisia tabaci TaxID=7038 RepID=A0A9P0F993_BEMTA|nr:unnamed protein product [Bemisia tabaci]
MSSAGTRSLKENLNYVQVAIAAAVAKRPHKAKEKDPRLVAVSKFKPKELIIEAYNAGQRHFGENYVQELVAKATDIEIMELCKDIRWHFIGHLQKNKIKHVVVLPKLYLLETVDSAQMATSVNNSVNTIYASQPDKKLNIMVQVNTSEEPEKSGISCSEVVDVVKHIHDTCPRLNFMGLMTIGEFGYDWSKGPNPDFLKLLVCRKNVCEALQLEEVDVELSMGMSDDYEKAIEMGSTNVRVGTAIFGAREPKKPATPAQPSQSTEAVTEKLKDLKT